MRNGCAAQPLDLNAQLSILNSAFPAQPLLPSISTSVSIYLFRGVFFKEGL